MSNSQNRRSRRTSSQHQNERHPDLRRLSRALIELAQAQAEAEAEVEHKAGQRPPRQGKP